MLTFQDDWHHTPVQRASHCNYYVKIAHVHRIDKLVCIWDDGSAVQVHP